MYNGDIGFVTDVEPGEGELTASFDGRSVTYGFGELDALVPAYAASIHKSQGSEYPAVVIPVMTQHYAMLQRNLLYTGVTRGKRLVVLVGQKKAVAIAVRNVSGSRRWSKLSEWLRPCPSGRFSLRCEMEFYPWQNGPQSTRYSSSFTCWEAEAKTIAEPMSGGRPTWKDASTNITRESVPSRLEGGDGYCSIPNAAKPAAKP